MRRREFIAGAVAASPLRARAQQRAKVAVIGCLSTAWQDGAAGRNLAAFRDVLRTLGYSEGRDLAFEYRFAEGHLDRLPKLASELVALKPDVILASATPAAIAARNATRTIPIVMVNVGDPEGLGLVASLARPGGNVTGLAYSVGLETLRKSLELLKELVPDLMSVAALMNAANPAHALSVRELRAAADSLGLEVQISEIRHSDEFEGAFASMARGRVGAVVVVPDTLSIRHAARIAELAMMVRLPSWHGFLEEVEQGGLISYGPSLTEPFRHAATFVDKLLKGVSPADLPVQQPSKFELAINLKTARTLGLTIPPTLLARADEVIE
jgi:putative ABC transport system substrate-binding protein